MSENIIKEKSFNFALEVIELYKKLKANNEFVLSKQLLRSWTSVGANVQEATSAQSKKDFLSKMFIAAKEARETKYWILLLDQSKIVNLNYTKYIQEIENIISILTKITKTTSINIKNNL